MNRWNSLATPPRAPRNEGDPQRNPRQPDGSGETPPPKRGNSPLIWLLLVFTLLFWAQQYWATRDIQRIGYSEFKNEVRADKIATVRVSGERITGEFKLQPGEQPEEPAEQPTTPQKPEDLIKLPGSGADERPHGKRFYTVRLTEDEELLPLLDKHDVKYDIELSTTWLSQLISWVAPLLILVLIWSFFFRKMFAGGGPGAGILSFGKSRARMNTETQVHVTFADVAGIEEAKAELSEVVDFLKQPEKYTKLGAKIPKGILLTGAPGTGKTLLARAVAGEAAVPFFSLSGSEFVEMFVGVGAARVRDLFEQAKKNAPCIVFVDEIDSMGGRRGVNPVAGGDEREQTLNQLLAEMDGFEPNSGVILLAATNRPDVLDPALLRAGRFDRHIIVDSPDVRGREAILKVHTRDVQLESDVDLRKLAGRTPGFVGADLANLINEAALTAARVGHTKVSEADLDSALDRITTGLERKSRVMNPHEREVVAHHEAGHALVAASLPNTDPVHKISIIPRSIGALGFTQQQPTEDRYLISREELKARLVVLLGGRTAEELIFGEVTTGASDDLSRATQMARAMVTRFGMSEKLGLRAYDEEKNPYLGVTQRGDYGDGTADLIDGEVSQILDEAHERAREILTRRKDRLIEIAKRLLDVEHLEGEDLDALLAPESPDAGQATSA
ncbi:MAG: ATP-dependent zinc metalloprotease FtsH [Chrysiogenetes bacterium]|nr:ATP-dependent zinc metalloprotease FtsH [Chrysiogenetes bacterium]